MLPQKNRLNLKTCFNWVASGETVFGTNLKLFLKKGTNLSPRIGIATSAKVFKRAVDRNRARRLLSTAFGRVYQSLSPNINIIAMPNSGILTLNSDKITEELNKLLKL